MSLAWSRCAIRKANWKATWPSHGPEGAFFMRIRWRTLFAPLLCAVTAYGADPALQAVFQRMDKAAATFKGFTADLVKLEHHAIIDDNEKQTGTIAVRKPTPHSIQVL